MGETRSERSARWMAVRDEVVDFLRLWLPDEAKETYRRMIRDDPVDWWRHPHFAAGVIEKHALRGNGIDEKVLGVADLGVVWPELLRAALDLPRNGNGGNAR